MPDVLAVAGLIIIVPLTALVGFDAEPLLLREDRM